MRFYIFHLRVFHLFRRASYIWRSLGFFLCRFCNLTCFLKRICVTRFPLGCFQRKPSLLLFFFFIAFFFEYFFLFFRLLFLFLSVCLLSHSLSCLQFLIVIAGTLGLCTKVILLMLCLLLVRIIFVRIFCVVF